MSMNTEELMDRLRNPAKYRANQSTASGRVSPDGTERQAVLLKHAARRRKTDWIIGGFISSLVLVTLLFWVLSKQRAENLTAALEPGQLEGLAVAEEEFNPHADVTYVQVQEGQDRNVAVSNLGSTLPILSRFNVQTMTDRNYEVIGAAPWALTTNFASNLSDPELIKYLLSNDKMIQAFLSRPDVAPLLEDPQMLAAFTEDQATMQDFFTNPTVQAVLADANMVRVVAGSRFMSHLLVSKSIKYFRNHPQEALSLIQGNAYLEPLRQNAAIRQAVQENPYLKSIASTLLENKSANRNTRSSKAGRK